MHSQTEHREEITDERWHKTTKRDVYDSLGDKYFHVGDFQKALEYSKLCLSIIAKDVGDKGAQGTAYRTLSVI